MKSSEVQVGKVYRVKVGRNLCDVRITAENRNGGWDGVSLSTNRPIRIKSPQRLRALAEGRPARRRRIVSLAEYEADAAQAPQPQPEPQAPPATPPAAAQGGKRLSGLDAAAQVLAEAGEPLSVGEVVRRMLERGLWSTGGKTPAATIYAAIIREIAVKGDASRFCKTDRGRFTVAA